MFGVGSYNNMIDIVQINTEEDKDTLLKMQAYYNHNESTINRASDICDDCLTDKDDRIFISRGYEYDDSFYILDTYNWYIKNLKNKAYGDLC